jgi:uncharacterized protein (TIGR03790 family)
MPLRGTHFGQAGMVCGLLLFALISFPAGALALSSRDLVVVYNRNVPDSQGVASYYAQKRHVPAENLVAVEVSTTEDMSRQDYEAKLVPPVRAMVDKLKSQGAAPAILLIYGIPLRVGAAPVTIPETQLKSLATAKVKEYQAEAVKLVGQLDRLTSGLPESPRLSYPTVEFLKKSQKSLAYGKEFLDQKSATPAAEADRDEVSSLLIRLRGASPEGRALMAGIARGGNLRRGLRTGEPLALPAQTLKDIEERSLRGILPDTAQETAAAARFTGGLLGELKFWYEVQRLYDKPQALAAVDSELTLAVAGPYQKVGWLPNPFNLRFDRISFINNVRTQSLMVGRLDGPTPAIARRLVDDALETEEAGLSGIFYLDAQGLTGQAEVGNYVWFDQHLLHLSDLVTEYSWMTVVLDKKSSLFPPGSCPDAALYCGWYSLRKYVPAFQWRKGAVAYHVASSEATTLRHAGSQVWCKRLLEEGVAATLGPVTEPYLFSFPLPDQFFPLLMTGNLTLLEVYFRTLPEVSWMQILIGDPLYRPFKNVPAMGAEGLMKALALPILN